MAPIHRGDVVDIKAGGVYMGDIEFAFRPNSLIVNHEPKETCMWCLVFACLTRSAHRHSRPPVRQPSLLCASLFGIDSLRSS